MNMIRRSSEGRCTTSTFSFSTRGKKIWSIEEDNQLKKLVGSLGTGNWTLVAESLPDRTGKQCRERWHNHLGAGIKKGDWTPEEDRIIISMQKAIGNQWAKITRMLPGRTDNAVKNRFHATERAKTRTKGDDSICVDPNYQIAVAHRVGGIHHTGSVDSSAGPQHGTPADHTPSDCQEQSDSAREENLPSAQFLQSPPHYRPHRHDHAAPARDAPLSVVGLPYQANDATGAASDSNMADHSIENAGGHGGCYYGDDADSATDLMDLDILSFTDEDLQLFDSFAAAPHGDTQHSGAHSSHHYHGSNHHQQHQQHQHHYHHGRAQQHHHYQQHQHPSGGGEVDPCCFLFDWTRGGAGDSSSSGAPPPPSLHQQYHPANGGESYRYQSRHFHHPPPHQQYQHHQQQHSSHHEPRYGCGIESWGCASSSGGRTNPNSARPPTEWAHGQPGQGTQHLPQPPFDPQQPQHMHGAVQNFHSGSPPVPPVPPCHSGHQSVFRPPDSAAPR